MHLLDNPIIINLLFYPRKALPVSGHAHLQDGTISIDDTIRLGYRLYVYRPDAPLILFFHGNGEIATDYDSIAPLFHAIHCSLLVIDYRGYGWSTGHPLTTALFTDAEKVITELPNVFKTTGIQPTGLYVMGRSLGSLPAVHLAETTPDQLHGLIIESGIAEIPSLIKHLGLPVPFLTQLEAHFARANNVDKIRQITLPLAVIHGEADDLLPVEGAQRLYEASPSAYKTILRVPRAGHNDLLMHNTQGYFAAIAHLIQHTKPG
ncbi:MAG: alpha/beta hydrolase [Anaerolineae bacterium]|jgi:hypothetical protein|nr:alpha/beta hydrolase [Anaerolineae bacterium]